MCASLSNRRTIARSTFFCTAALCIGWSGSVLSEPNTSASCSGTVVSSDGTWSVSYRPTEAVRLRELHAFVFDIAPSKQNAPSACPDMVEVDMSMPAHNHGMQTRPDLTSLNQCQFLYDGGVWHMPGLWRIRLVLHSGARSEQAIADVDVGLTGCP